MLELLQGCRIWRRLNAKCSNAVAKSRTAAAKPVNSTVEHRAALQSFADDTVMELRIPLSRMLRLISRATDLHPSAATELGGLKEVCREMWDYLDNVQQTAAERP